VGQAGAVAKSHDARRARLWAFSMMPSTDAMDALITPCDPAHSSRCGCGVRLLRVEYPGEEQVMKRTRPTIAILGALFVISTGALANTVTVYNLMFFDGHNHVIVQTYRSFPFCQQELLKRQREPDRGRGYYCEEVEQRVP
jgi:hypothetical protein